LPKTPNESGTFKIKERTSKKAVWVEAEDGLRKKVMVPVKEVSGRATTSRGAAPRGSR
jgi:hypothetical protein